MLQHVLMQQGQAEEERCEGRGDSEKGGRGGWRWRGEEYGGSANLLLLLLQTMFFCLQRVERAFHSLQCDAKQFRLCVDSG
jgi:hypothetical protein